MIANKLILVLVLRFLVTGLLALLVLTPIFAFLAAGTEDVTTWQVIGLYLAAAMVGVLELLMYLRRRRRANQNADRLDHSDLSGMS